jgi:hypothetical protein
MIINGTRRAPSRDIAAFAWSGLRRYLNEALVSKEIADLHHLKKDQLANARKQARHIRYCLMQAREYADAAERVSLVTKPTLYYYCVMCLALAETLLKQDGRSSLDEARQQHSHHGLRFKVGALPKESLSLVEPAKALRAVPAVTSLGKRYGTFELWHMSARELPIVGEVTFYHDVGNTSGPRVLFGTSDVRLAELPSAGMTLLHALQRLPAMTDHLEGSKIVPEFVSARAIRTFFYARPRQVEWEIIIHPTLHSLLDRFLELWTWQPDAHRFVDFVPVGQNGGNITFSCDEDDAPKVKIPHASMLSENDVRFWLDERPPLNEFGWYYVALFIAGNYARYYPDRWVVDVERNTPLALAIDELLRTAVFRVPLLALSEMSRTYLVPQAWH